jgi:hypothetical protein
MSTSAWQAATAGQAPQAAHVQQLLGTHAIQALYAAALQASQSTAGSTSTAGNGLYIAQRFTTGASQTAVGYISIPLTTTVTSGASLAATTVSLYTDNAGVPSSSVLVSTTVTAEYANLASGGTATTSLIYPLPAAALTASTQYWIVVAPAGTSGAHFTWYQSNQTSGASTSTNGTTWTGQTYGLLFKVYDQAASGLRTCTWEDSGARWTASTYTSSGLISQYAEYTAGQTAAGYLQSVRGLSYTSSTLTGVV